MEVVKKSQNKKLLYIFVIIALLHLICLWLLFKKRSAFILKEDTQIPEKNLIDKQWVKLQSSPGAPVIFKAVPQSSIQSLNSVQTETSEISQQTTSTRAIQKTDIKESKVANLIEKPHVITQVNAIFSIPTRSEQEHKEQSLTQHDAIVESNESQSTSNNKPLTGNKPSPFSFNNLVQGFAQHLQEQQGTDDYAMRSKNVGKATAEQIRYAQYGSKICSAIHNAFLINKEKHSFTIRRNDPVVVKIVINKNGTLSNTHIIKTSHSQSIDQLVTTIIQGAAQSFPPLPEFFAMDQCPFVITINNALQVIEHPEQSYWTL